VDHAVIPEEYDQCVFIRYYTICRRVFIPTVLKAGAGPHQLPGGSPRSDKEILVVSSDDDSTEVDHLETGSPLNTSDEVIHIYHYSRTGTRMTAMALMLL